MILQSRHYHKQGIFQSLEDAENNHRIILPCRETDNLFIPPLPDIYNYIVNGRTYRCQPNLVRCTCSYAMRVSRLYDPGDIRTVCKHLSSEYARNSFVGFSPILKELTGFVHQKEKVWLFCINQETYTWYVSWLETKEWLEIFIVEGDIVVRYGYNILTGRWRRGQHPAGAAQLLQMLNNYFFVRRSSL
ncbi:MAG: hypothetical protein LWX56_10345 [Ignavibacteria bacterium]|nr:hypothetical protein [Ignavibacteria bacterium]